MSQTHADNLILDHLLSLLDNLVDPDFDLFLRLLFRRLYSRLRLLAALLVLILQILLTLAPPRIPLIHKPPPLGNELSTDVTLFRGIFLVELPAVLLEILTDLALLLLSK